MDRNIRFLRKEIDLGVEKDGLVAFVEVKGRSGPAFGHPLEARSYRFDAVSVYSDGAGTVEVEHIEGAWME